MKNIPALLLTLTVSFAALTEAAEIPNRLIDYDAFMSDARKVAILRVQRRVTEEQFIKLSIQPGTIIYDARTKDKFEMLHVKGARHLALTDVTAETLAQIFPKKDTPILIYCNNNFLNEPVAFASKSGGASLNIYTFNTLYNYGYTNVYELGPLTDIRNSKLPMEGTRVKAKVTN
ncbi:MAG TPA: rhodanese-like domain-containing protein [Verrucomicrobiae bacterium]